MNDKRIWLGIGAVVLLTPLIGVFLIQRFVSEEPKTVSAPTESNHGKSGGDQLATSLSPSEQASRASAEGSSMDASHLATSESQINSDNAAATATVVVDGKTYELETNQIGAFRQINVGAKVTVAIKVHYSQGNPGDVVAAQVLDGGALKDGKHIADAPALDASGNINLQFTSGDQNGIYRIKLMKGGDFKTLNFWVGPPLQVRGVASSQ